MSGAPVFLYYGACGLCSRSVRFVLARERDHEMRFVALQSREGRGLASRYGVDPDDPASFLFIADGRALSRSDGVLAVLDRLDGPARWLRVGRLAPKPLRDWLYDRIARNRYRLFGREVACPAPDPAVRARFSPPDRP